MALTQEEQTILTQLKGLAAQNRITADIFERAADMHESGYQIDQARIDADIQVYKDSVQAQMASLTMANVDLDAQLIAKQTELDTANAEIQRLRDLYEK